MMRVAALASCALLLAGGQARFRAERDAVHIDALVTDGNRPVGGLDADDFEVADEGVAQTVLDVQTREVPFSMQLVLDTSSSVAGEPLRDLKRAAAAALASLQTGDRASMLFFSDTVDRLGRWDTPPSSIAAQLDRVSAGGGTALFDAAAVALHAVDPEQGRRHLIVLFTDGIDTASWLPPDAVLDLSDRSDAVIYAVTTGQERDLHQLKFRSGIRLTSRQPVISSLDFLREVSGRTGGDVRYAPTTDLHRVFQEIVTEFRTRYLISYQPEGVSPSGWHRVTVKVKGGRGKVTARRGYQR